MRPIRLLLTACGCPGASTLIRMLKNNGEREIEIIGVDADDQAVGRFLADSFHQVPLGESSDYIPHMLELVERVRPDVLFPESSLEVYPIALHKKDFEEMGTAVVVSDPDAIALSSNKYLMYEALKRETDLELPEYRYPRDLDEFVTAAHELGYPANAVTFKPHVGKGSRGFRIIDAEVDRRDMLLNHKPNNRYMSLEEFIEIFGEDQDFPDLILNKNLVGMEYTTDPLAFEGELLLCTAKTVEEARWGVIVKGELVDRPQLVEQTRKVLNTIKLSYNVNIQFIEDSLIEINPRVSSFIYQDDLIAPYLAVKLALGELQPDEVVDYSREIAYGTRMVRYMDQVFWSP